MNVTRSLDQAAGDDVGFACNIGQLVMLSLLDGMKKEQDLVAQLSRDAASNWNLNVSESEVRSVMQGIKEEGLISYQHIGQTVYVHFALDRMPQIRKSLVLEGANVND